MRRNLKNSAFIGAILLIGFLIFNNVLLFAQSLMMPLKPCNDRLTSQIMTLTASFSGQSSKTDSKELTNVLKTIETTEIKNSEDIKLFLRTSYALMNAGNYNSATTLLAKVLEKDPENMDALFNIAICYDNKGDLTKALEYYLKLEKINTYIHGLHNNIGWLYWRLDKQNVKQVEEEYELEMKYNPTSGSPYQNRALVHRHRGDNERAFQDYKKGVELDGDELESILITARFSEQYEVHKKEGIEFINTALRLYPDSWRAWEIKAGFYYHEGKYKKAEKLYLHSIRLFPRATTYYELCWTYVKMGRLGLAKKAYEKARSMDQVGDTCYEENARKMLEEKGLKVETTH